MVRKVKYSYEMRIKIVQDYESGKASKEDISKQSGVSIRQIEDWVYKYRREGETGLRIEAKNRKYAAEVKNAAVADYITGGYTQEEVCRKYQIRARKQLCNWIKQYNGCEELKSSCKGGSIVTKGRKTTFDERVEIVKSSIEEQHNYNEIAERYKVSYQQVRNWTVKYEQSGVEGLEDRRGRQKPESELTELEKMRAENKLLEAKNRRLELENLFLKKLKELEGGGE